MPIWPNQPPAPVQRRRAWPIVVPLVALVLVSALVVAVVYAVHSVSSAAQRAAATPGASESPSASPSVEAVYAHMPDPCALGTALPQQVASIKADASRSTPELPFCRWEVLQTDHALYLKVQLKPQKAGAAHGQFANDLAYAGDTGKNGGYAKNPVAVPGLGDEAFTAELYNPIIYGKTEADAKTYAMGGAQVEVRARNVIIDIGWVGATYPAGAANGKVLRGTQLQYAQARDQAIAIARQLVAGFK